jgi:hypothetical protein
MYEHWSSLRKARAIKEMSDYLLTHCYSEYTTWKKHCPYWVEGATEEHCPYWVEGATEEEYFESIVEFVSTQGNFENALFVFYCLVV